MNTIKWDTICAGCEAVILFLMGPVIGVEGLLGLVTITLLNTLIWIALKKQYGTTVGRVIKKQSLELLVSISLLFALRFVFKAIRVAGVEQLVFMVLIVRQVLFLVLIAKQVFDNHDLDKNNSITNMAFGKIVKSLLDTFGLDTKDANNEDPLASGDRNMRQSGTEMNGFNNIHMVDQNGTQDNTSNDGDSITDNNPMVEDPYPDGDIPDDPTEDL